MPTISSCPRCDQHITLPDGADPSVRVRCPLCHAEYTLQEALHRVPPTLLMVSSAIEEEVSDVEPAEDVDLHLFAEADSRLAPADEEALPVDLDLAEPEVEMVSFAAESLTEPTHEELDFGEEEISSAEPETDELSFEELSEPTDLEPALAEATTPSETFVPFDLSDEEPAAQAEESSFEELNFDAPESGEKVPFDDSLFEPAEEAAETESSEELELPHDDSFSFGDAPADVDSSEESVPDKPAPVAPMVKKGKAKTASKRSPLVRMLVMATSPLVAAVLAYAFLLYVMHTDPLGVASSTLPNWMLPSALAKKKPVLPSFPVATAPATQTIPQTPPSPSVDDTALADSEPLAGEPADDDMSGSDALADNSTPSGSSSDKMDDSADELVDDATPPSPDQDDLSQMASGIDSPGEESGSDDAASQAIAQAGTHKASNLPAEDEADPLGADSEMADVDANKVDEATDEATEAASDSPSSESLADDPLGNDHPADPAKPALSAEESAVEPLSDNPLDDDPLQENPTAKNPLDDDPLNVNPLDDDGEAPAADSPPTADLATAKSPLMTDDPLADEPGDEGEPLSDNEPTVGPRDPGFYSNADMDQAIAKAAAASKKLASADASDKNQTKNLKRQFYVDLYHMAEVATFSGHGQHSAGSQDAKLQAVQQFVSAAAVTQFTAMGNAARQWLAQKKGEEHLGVVLAGTVQSVNKQGDLFEMHVQLAGSSTVVCVLSDQAPTVREQDRAIVVGSVVDEPAKNIAGYQGDEPTAVWSGLTFKAPPAG